MVHLFMTTVALILGAVPGHPSVLVAGDFGPSGAVNRQIPAPSADTLETAWVLEEGDSEARYRVREQLAGFEFPNDAVGRTGEVKGTLVLGPDGSIISAQSEFRIQLVSLVSDNERRDRYVRGRTLEVDQYPEAVLVPQRTAGLPSPLPTSGSVTFQLEGALTLHGLTRPTLWEVTAEFGPETISGFATTSFLFDTFRITVPQVARVLSVAETIHLELDFRMVPKGK